jgi:hypothetical protein
MKRRIVGSALFAAVVALGAVALTEPTPAVIHLPGAAAPGVTLDAATMELAAAKPTSSPSATPCNGGGGAGHGFGNCSTPTPTPRPTPTSTPTPTPVPTATPCGTGCKPLLVDSKSPGPILTASRMKPGDVARGSVVITANGSVFVSLFESNISNSGPAGSGNLAHRLNLVITDQTLNVQLYSGALDSMPATISVCGQGTPPNQPCQRWANGEAHTFLFVVTFPNAPNDSDNAFQMTGASATFTWGATR